MNAELVSRYTSQLIATVCIHVPLNETSCPEKKSLKFLEPSDRSMTFKLEVRLTCLFFDTI
jgi:hypothetical protein